MDYSFMFIQLGFPRGWQKQKNHFANTVLKIIIIKKANIFFCPKYFFLIKQLQQQTKRTTYRWSKGFYLKDSKQAKEYGASHSMLWGLADFSVTELRSARYKEPPGRYLITCNTKKAKAELKP